MDEEDREELKMLVEQQRSEVYLRNKRWRELNPGYARKRLVQWQRQRKEKMIAMKGGKCADCGGVFPPYAYDFHHIEGRDHALPRLKNMTWKQTVAELEKCVLLCAICHRGRHAISEEDLIIPKRKRSVDIDDGLDF